MKERRARTKDRRNHKIRKQLPCWDHDNNIVTKDRRKVPDRRTDDVVAVGDEEKMENSS